MAKPEYKTISGITFPAQWHDIACLFWLFRNAPRLQQDPNGWWFSERDKAPFLTTPDFPERSDTPYTGLGRYEHSVALDRMLFPGLMEYSPWAEDFMSDFCGNDHNAISGPGGSGKSHAAGNYGWKFFQCDPLNSAVLVISTTIAASKRRIWKNVSAFYSEFCQLTRYKEDVMLGNPRPSICPLVKDVSGHFKRDEALGMHVVAVAGGELIKGINSLKGFHPKRLLIIRDECDSIEQAAVDVDDNLRIGCEEFQTIDLGNDPSLFNPFGKLMEPAPGTPVGMEHREWISTSGIHCRRVDAFDSPNLTDNDKWKGIIRQRDIDKITKNGTQMNTPMVYIMLHGIHPPAGVEDTVLSESLFFRYNCSKPVNWARSYIASVLLDPAFGGDRCVMRKMYRGLDTENKMRLLFGPPIEIPIDVSQKENPPEYQIAAAVKTFCTKEGVPPQEFIGDGTGTGRGVMSVIQREWSPLINVCEFGGSPSQLAVSDEDNRPANEVYDRKVTELWYSFREFVEADMIRGLDTATAQEFCSRRFEIKAKKKSVETKGEMKGRGLKSPDNADNAVLGVDLARRKGITAVIATTSKQAAERNWSQVGKEYDFDGRADGYQEYAEAI